MSTEELASVRPSATDLKVSVVGVGGAGNNLLSHAIGGGGLSPSHCIAVNTDRLQLSRSPARNKVLLANVQEKGHIGEFRNGERLQLSIRRVTPFTEASDLTIVVAGLGGETGTGAAPLIAASSRSYVRPVVSVVAIPFIHERSRRFIALRGLKKMVEACDCTIVIDNSIETNPPSSEGRRADELASLALSGLTNLASQIGPMRQEEFRRIISLGPIAVLCSAPIKSEHGIQSAIFTALKNPSARLPISKARGGILIHRGPDELGSGRAAQAYETLASLAGHQIDFSYGSIQNDLDPSVSLILTGYDYGSTVRAFVDFIEDLYDVEYGETSPGSLVRLGFPLFQMEQA